MAKKKTRRNVATTPKLSRSKARRLSGYHSLFEASTAKELDRLGVEWSYETLSLQYVVPITKHKYKPDFIVERSDGSVLIIETKGIFTAADRKKHLLIKQQYPELDIRLVFYRASKRIGKSNKSLTYGQWATKNGFTWSDKVLPKEWF